VKVGDLVQTTKNGAGIGDTWTRPGVMCMVVGVHEVSVNPTLKGLPVKNIMVTVVIPSLGEERTFHKLGLEVISECR